MILFSAPGSSSQAAHILLRTANLPFELEQVDLMRQTWAGGDYTRVNPKSCVPALQLDDGTVLTECAAILLYIADHAPSQGLIPAFRTPARYRALEWLNFIATELHKNFIAPERHGGRGANFLPDTEAGRLIAEARVSPRLDYVDQHLSRQEYLLGDTFSAPDAYLFTMLTWVDRLQLSSANWKNLQAFKRRVESFDSVQTTLAVEGPAHTHADVGRMLKSSPATARRG